MSYKFTEYLQHADQGKAELLDWYRRIKNIEMSVRDEQMASNAYLSGMRDAANLIKLHGGFRFRR